MERWKKGLVLAIAVVMAGTAVVATQYAKVQVSYDFTVSTRYSSIQLMASDGAISGTGYLLQNLSDAYTVSLGTWMKGMNKTFTAAFAIVNGETGTDLRITRVNATGLASGAKVRIWLHENMSTPSDYSVSYTTRETGANGANAQTCEKNDATLLYFNNTTAVDHSSSGWILAKANQTNEPYTSNLLYYHNAPVAGAATEVATTWDATNVYVYNPTLTTANGLRCGSATYTSGSGYANYVWVEVTVDTSGVSASYVSISGTIDIYFQSI